MPRLRSPSLLIAIMLLAAGWALALGAHTYWYVGGLTLLLTIHLLWGFRLAGRPTILTETLLFLPFAAWFHYSSPTAFSGFAPVDVLFILGFYLLALGVHHLLSLSGGGSRHQAFAAAIIAMTLAGTAPQPVPFFLPFLLIFVVAVLLELRQSQGLLNFRPTRGQLAHFAVVLALLASLAAFIQYLDVVQLPLLNRWLNQKMLNGMVRESVGFSRVTHLGAISATWERDGQRIELRQWSDQPAAYLRTAVYEYYDQGTWMPVRDTRDLRSQTQDHGRTYFNMLVDGNPAAPTDAPVAMIYCASDLAEDFFLPLGAQRLSAFGDRILVSDVLTARSPTHQAAGGYEIYPPAVDANRPALEDLEIPASIRPALARLARELVDQPAAGAALKSKPWDALPRTPRVSPEFAALRIALYFRQYFTYRLGQKLSRGKDPVLEFLEDVKAGHCEYFASAGTLLLRSLDIPARYVTGFLCDEPGPGRKYLLARGKDAHAWVEYYVKGRGWMTFDPTPPDDRPAAVHPGAAQLLKERIGAWWQRIWAVAAYGGILAVFAIVWSAMLDLLAWIPRVVWLIVIAAGSAWVFRARLRALLGGRAREVESTRVRDLRGKLRRAEKLLARHGLTRPPSMTVGAFLRTAVAAPLPPTNKETALALLREYQSQRFRPGY